MAAFNEITKLPERVSGNKPDADGELWNERYVEIDDNFDVLEGGSPGEFWGAGGAFSVPSGTGVTNGHVIQEEGTPIAQRANLDFQGGGVTASNDVSASKVVIPSSAEEIASASEKTTPVDADKLGLFDSVAGGVLKWLSWANIKVALASVFSPKITYNAITVTTSNITAAENNHYDLTIAGLTAERKFLLPTPSKAGVRISFRLLDGNDDYSIMPEKDGSDIDGLNCFIAGESLIFKSIGTDAEDWEIAEGGNGLISNICNLSERTTTTTIATSTEVIIEVNTVDEDNANLADATNNKIVVRRAGKYFSYGQLQLGIFPAASARNDLTVDVSPGGELNKKRSACGNGEYWSEYSSYVVSLDVGDEITLVGRQQSGSPVNTIVGAATSFIGIKEILQ